MAAPDKVKNPVEEFERLKGGPVPDSFDEARLCTSYVEPFWKALGWGVRDPREVVKEKRVHLRAGTKHADYCFQLKGKPQHILEAKDSRRLDDADKQRLQRAIAAPDRNVDAAPYGRNAVRPYPTTPLPGRDAMSDPVRLSKPFYLAALLGLHAGVAALAAGLFGLVPGENVAPLFFPASMVLQAAFLAVLFFFWYRAWKAVYSPGAGFTPAARILKLLIPIYHIYWCFPAFWGWPKRYNEYLREKNVALPPVKGFVFFIFSLLFAASIASVYIRIVLLFLGFSGGMETPVGAVVFHEVIYIVIMGGITWYVCAAVNRLPAVPDESAAESVPETPRPSPVGQTL